MLRAVISMHHLGQVILPIGFLLLLQCSEHLQQCRIKPLCRVSLWMVRCSSGVRHSSQLLQGFEKGIFKLTALVVVQSGWKPKSRNEIIKYLLRSSPSRFVSSSIDLSKSAEMINHEIMITFALLQIHVIY